MIDKSLARRVLDSLFLRMGYIYNPKNHIIGSKLGELPMPLVDTIGDIFDGLPNNVVQGVLSYFLGRSIYFSISSEKHLQHLIDVALYNVCQGINQTSEIEGDEIRIENPVPMNDVANFKETIH